MKDKIKKFFRVGSAVTVALSIIGFYLACALACLGYIKLGIKLLFSPVSL